MDDPNQQALFALAETLYREECERNGKAPDRLIGPDFMADIEERERGRAQFKIGWVILRNDRGATVAVFERTGDLSLEALPGQLNEDGQLRFDGRDFNDPDFLDP